MNNISPVTENDMRDFFERLISSFVGLSEQAKELTALREHIQSIDERFAQLTADREKALSEVNALKADNQFLVRQSGEYSTLAQTYSNERDEALRKLHELETANAKQGEIIKAQKDGLDRLNTQVAELTSQAIENRNEELFLKDNLKKALTELETAQIERGEAISKLNAITAALNPIQPKPEARVIPITENKIEDMPTPTPSAPEMLPVIEDKPAEEEKPWYARNPSSNW